MDIKNAYTRIFLEAAGIESSEENIKQYKNIWWWNLRSDGGLRLTENAFTFIEEDAKIKTYRIDFPKEFSITPQVLLWLDHFIDSPFYITKKFIIVLKEKAAFELYLFSGDIKKLGYNKTLAKRMIQDSPDE